MVVRHLTTSYEISQPSYDCNRVQMLTSASRQTIIVKSCDPVRLSYDGRTSSIRLSKIIYVIVLTASQAHLFQCDHKIKIVMSQPSRGQSQISRILPRSLKLRHSQFTCWTGWELRYQSHTRFCFHVYVSVTNWITINDKGHRILPTTKWCKKISVHVGLSDLQTTTINHQSFCKCTIFCVYRVNCQILPIYKYIQRRIDENVYEVLVQLLVVSFQQ